MEILVSSALVMLLMGEIWMLIQSGSRYYLRVRGQSEVQRSALVALRWFSRDLAEGAPLSFKHYHPDNPTTPTTRNGLVFGSSRDLNEVIQYNETGRNLWTTMTGYYIDPESRNLYRTKTLLPEQVVAAPVVDDEFFHIDILAANPQKRLIASHVENLSTVPGPRDVTIEVHCRDIKLGFGLFVRTKLELKNK